PSRFRPWPTSNRSRNSAAGQPSDRVDESPEKIFHPSVRFRVSDLPPVDLAGVEGCHLAGARPRILVDQAATTTHHPSASPARVSKVQGVFVLRWQDPCGQRSSGVADSAGNRLDHSLLEDLVQRRFLHPVVLDAKVVEGKLDLKNQTVSSCRHAAV